MQTQSESDHMNRKLSANFWAREFICLCCKEEGIKDELIFHLQLVHNMLPKNSVMIITSGYRCVEYNAEVGGIPDSAHIKGLAADIKCEDATYKFYLIKALIKVGFERIGEYHDFLHVDLDPDKPKPVIW